MGQVHTDSNRGFFNGTRLFPTLARSALTHPTSQQPFFLPHTDPVALDIYLTAILVPRYELGEDALAHFKHRLGNASREFGE